MDVSEGPRAAPAAEYSTGSGRGQASPSARRRRARRGAARRGLGGSRAGPAGARASAAAPARAASGATAPWSPRRRIAGHVHAAERRRAGVLRVLEQPVGERLLGGRGLLDRAGQQPDDRVDDDERRQLAAGQDVVADRQLEVDERADPLVDALVARADEDEVRSARRGRRPAPGGRPRRPGRAGSPSSPARRSASSAAATGSGRRIIPAPPPYGASSTRPVAAEAPVAQVVDPDRRRGPAPGCGRGCSRRAGPSSIAGKRVRTSISRVMRRSAGGRVSAGGGRSARCGVGRLAGSVDARRRRASAPAARRLRAVGDPVAAIVGGRRSSASASTTISPRRGAKIRMKARTAGRSNSPYGPPPTMKTSVSPTR